MDELLNEIRSFITAMEQAKGVSDATTQKKIILDSFATLRSASAAQYRGGCTSALDVNPKRISFAGTIPERSVQITNRGNTDLTFSVDGLPEAFDPKPVSGTLPRATTISVAILRTILPLTGTDSLRFHVRSNMQDDEVVEIQTDAKSATMWKDLADRAGRVQSASGKTGAALSAVDAAVTDRRALSEADRFRLASCVLATMGESGAAAETLAIAKKADPSIESRPSTAILSGIIQLQKNQYTAAQSSFADAKRKAGKDPVANSASDLLVGWSLLNRVNANAATDYLKASPHLGFIQQNPGLQAFANRYACPGQQCTTMLLKNVF